MSHSFSRMVLAQTKKNPVVLVSGLLEINRIKKNDKCSRMAVFTFDLFS